MSSVYVYSPLEVDEDGFGLVGNLAAKSCIFTEVGNESSTLEIELMLDENGYHRLIQPGYIIAVAVPVLTTPIIDDDTNNIATSVMVYRTDFDADKEDRQLFYRYDPNTDQAEGVRTTLDVNELVTVIESSANWSYWKVKNAKKTGWIKRDVLIGRREVTKEATSATVEGILGASLKTQFFRIRSVSRRINSIIIDAEHITYDLIDNVTNINITTHVLACDAFKEAISNCIYNKHPFKGYSNAHDELTSAAYPGWNPIQAILDDERGMIADIGDAALVRDNYDLYLISNPGTYRGMQIRYGVNMVGFEYFEDWSDTLTHIYPYGKTSAGADSFIPLTTAAELGDEYYLGIDPDIPDYYGAISRGYLRAWHPEMLPEEDRGEEATYAAIYPVPRIERWDTEIQVESGVLTLAQMRILMRQKAAARFIKDGVDQPRVRLDIDFTSVSDDERLAYFGNVENVHLWDVVRIINPEHGVDTMAMCTAIEWDCLGDRMQKATFETVAVETSYNARDAAFCTRDADHFIIPTYVQDDPLKGD